MLAIIYNLLLTIQTAITTIGTNVVSLVTNLGTANANIATVKADTTTLKNNETSILADTSLLKAAAGTNANYGDNLTTQITDMTTLVLNLTGKYELLGLVLLVASTAITVQIDGATNRKIIQIPSTSTLSLLGMGIKCANSINIYASGNIGSVKVIYRLLP